LRARRPALGGTPQCSRRKVDTNEAMSCIGPWSRFPMPRRTPSRVNEDERASRRRRIAGAAEKQGHAVPKPARFCRSAGSPLNIPAGPRWQKFRGAFDSVRSSCTIKAISSAENRRRNGYHRFAALDKLRVGPLRVAPFRGSDIRLVEKRSLAVRISLSPAESHPRVVARLHRRNSHGRRWRGRTPVIDTDGFWHRPA